MNLVQELLCSKDANVLCVCPLRGDWCERSCPLCAEVQELFHIFCQDAGRTNKRLFYFFPFCLSVHCCAGFLCYL